MNIYLFCFTDISRNPYIRPPTNGLWVGWASKVRPIAHCWLGFGPGVRAHLWALWNTRPDVRVSRRYWAIGSLISIDPSMDVIIVHYIRWSRTPGGPSRAAQVGPVNRRRLTTYGGHDYLKCIYMPQAKNVPP